MKSELIKEVWKPVLGYEGLYEVSNFGRVRSLNFNHTGKPKTLSPKKEKNGYLRLCLFKHGKRKYLNIHRLVYEAFNDQIPEGMQVNHINEIKTDNSVWNLNIMTPKENQNYGHCIKKRVEKQRNHPNESKQLYQYTYPDLKFVAVWPSIKEAVRNGFNEGGIWYCCHGKYKQHKGFLWSHTPIN